MSKSVIAVDLGATSGRVVLATFDDGRVHLAEQHRFSTAAVRTAEGLQLDAPALFAEIQAGIGKAMAAAGGAVAAIGIDSWAVDYGLVDGEGLIGWPFNYRDNRTAAGREAVQAVVPQPELYARTGIQDTPFNTVNQLADDLAHGRLDDAENFLLLPDLLGYWLTGRRFAERTNASSTALLDPITREWDWGLIDRLGLPRRIFPELVEPGTVIGPVMEGPGVGVPLVAVGSHDTASAVVAAPLRDLDDVYLSSGTWSLIGMELDSPVLTAESRAANLTNEGGVDGTVRYLKNVMGLWILSEAVREWRGQGLDVSIPDLVAEAATIQGAPRFDATDPCLLPPGDMLGRVKHLVGSDSRTEDPAFFARSVLESLADAYARAVAELRRLTGRTPKRVAIVGGGSNNKVLSQLTANRTGLEVTAGPAEATAIGNALIQARAVGLITGTLSDLRRIVMASSDITTFTPAPERPGPLLAALTELSNEFGADPAFVRAGGGNSSVKSDGVLWIKPSGVSMAALSPADFVPLDQDVLLAAFDEPDPDPAGDDPIVQIAVRARLDDGPRRPSVELLFHALIPETFVLHTHPVLINAVTCNADGEAITERLFGDGILWVPYVDPGLPLAREIRARRRAFTARTGQEPPRATFLANHGLIVSGDTIDEVRVESYRIQGRVEAALAEANAPLKTLAESFRSALGAAHVAVDTGALAASFPAQPDGGAFLTAGPLIPDQIVYAGSFPLVLSAGADVATELAGFRSKYGKDPVVAVVPGRGAAAVGDSDKSARTALEVYVDALLVARAANQLGRVRALDAREYGFIEDWESEAYRKQMAKS